MGNGRKETEDGEAVRRVPDPAQGVVRRQAAERAAPVPDREAQARTARGRGEVMPNRELSVFREIFNRAIALGTYEGGTWSRW